MPPKKPVVTLTPDEKRAKFTVKYDAKVVRIEDVQRDAVKFVAHQLKALQEESISGLGYKGDAVSSEVVNKLAKLTAALNSLTEGERRLLATRKDRAEQMTPEEELVAVKDYLRSREPQLLRDTLRELRDWHNETYTQATLTTPIGDE